MYTPIDNRHVFTRKCRQLVENEIIGPVSGLAICQYNSEDAFYLFGCNKDWQSITDTWHQSIEDAISQAEFEYENTSKTWINKKQQK